VFVDERGSSERSARQSRDRAERREAEQNREIPSQSVASLDHPREQAVDSGRTVDQAGHDDR
jgi:hypothetical protein